MAAATTPSPFRRVLALAAGLGVVRLAPTAPRYHVNPFGPRYAICDGCGRVQSYHKTRHRRLATLPDCGCGGRYRRARVS